MALNPTDPNRTRRIIEVLLARDDNARFTRSSPVPGDNDFLNIGRRKPGVIGQRGHRGRSNVTARGTANTKRESVRGLAVIFIWQILILRPGLVVTTNVARWRNGYSVGLAIGRSRIQILLGATLRNNLGQVVHTYVPLSFIFVLCITVCCMHDCLGL